MSFKIGDRVMVIYRPDIHYIAAKPGMVGTVVGPLMKAPLPPGTFADGLAHQVKFEDRVLWSMPKLLRKIDDDSNHRALGRWADCPWRPEQVRA